MRLFRPLKKLRFFKRGFNILLFFGFLFALTAGAVTVFSIVRTEKSNQLAIGAHEVAVRLENLRFSLQIMSLSYRTYLFTQDPELLVRFEQAAKESRIWMQQLESDFRDSPLESEQMRKLVDLYRERMKLARESRTTLESEGLGALAEKMKDTARQNLPFLMDEIVARLIQEQADSVRQHERRAKRDYRISSTAILACVASCLGFGSWAVFLLNGEVARSAQRTLAAMEAERLVQQMNDQLEKRVRERTVELESANKELEAFAYSVAHDLRAPLRAVSSYAHILTEDYAAKLDAEAMRITGVITGESRRMGVLIDELLNFSRIGRQQINHQIVDMRGMAQSVFEEQLAVHGRSGVGFDLGDLPPAVGDRILLRQVWSNLIDNAIKYTRNRPEVLIRIRGSVSDGFLKYVVEDNGVGFDPRFTHKLFGVFQRLHTLDEFEGTGVGLAIVQRIVSRHGGQVSAEGKPGVGAAFSFTLPQHPDGNPQHA
ncbi:MAG: ATP-binding protein [Candidatus Methylacidiphilales bacterium]|nr:ATP-binding protein [Candidatus Methylacidiphilales bacterium]